MLEIEKANFAIWFVKKLLFIDKKILAIATVRKLYDCSIADAKRFVDNIKICESGISAEQEFIDKLFKNDKEKENAVSR